MKRRELDVIEQLVGQNWKLAQALIDTNKRLGDLLDRTLDAATVQKEDQIQRVISDYESGGAGENPSRVVRMPEPVYPEDPGEITGSWTEPGP